MIAMCGYPKSGNFLLWNTLRIIQEYYHEFSSYSETNKILSSRSIPFLFERHESVDEITFDSDSKSLYLRKLKVLHPVDIETLSENSSLLWSHDVLTSEHFRLFEKTNATIFYIVRDPRSVCLSLAYHIVRPEYLANFPDAKLTDAKEVLSDLSFTEKWAIRWKEHVSEALVAGDKINFIKYEDLNSDKEGTIISILKIMNKYNSMESKSVIDRIKEETSFTEMKKKSPTHVRSGKNKGWENELPDPCVELIQKIARSEMQTLGY